MLTYTAQLGLSQYIPGPTRNNNLRDLVITNTPDILHGLSIQTSFSTSDHVFIHFSLYVGTYATTSSSVSLSMPRYNYARANFQAFIADLLSSD